MRKILMILGGCVGAFVILFLLFFFFAPWNMHLYPKVWRANIAIDRVASPQSSLFLRQRGRSAGIVIRKGDHGSEEAYAFDYEAEIATVRRCEVSSFALLLGLAVIGHERTDKGCLLAAWPGQGPMGKAVDLNARIDRHSEVFIGRVEFTTDDGKRVRAEW